LDIPHEIVGISEIDKYAIKSYEAIFGETRNYGDISKVSKLDYADLWTYGFPCQDISLAGNQAGIIKGQTRSGLLYEVQRLLGMAALYDELPKYLILENVKNLVGKKFLPAFNDWIEWLNSIGYNTYWKVINAKNCGIPQHRERVFAVSIRKDVDKGFRFPDPIPLTKSMFDLLEDEVDDKYYLSEAAVEFYMVNSANCAANGSGFSFEPRERERERRNSQNDHDQGWLPDDGQLHQGTLPPLQCHEVGRLIGGKWEKMYDQSRRVYGTDGLSPTIHTAQGGNQEIKILIPQATQKGYIECIGGGSLT